MHMQACSEKPKYLVSPPVPRKSQRPECCRRDPKSRVRAPKHNHSYQKKEASFREEIKWTEP